VQVNQASVATMSYFTYIAIATANNNSSGDEIANVNFYAVRPGTYPNSLK